MSLNKFMHPRNIYRTPPNFDELASIHPEFREHAKANERGKLCIDFKDSNAIRSLTKALLKKDFGLSVEIPEHCLIPTVPQRLNYILWIEDLLDILPNNGKFIKGIDVGTGPCCIFSMLGAKKNCWRFLATESNESSIIWARKNVELNGLQDFIELIKTESDTILGDVVSPRDEMFDFCLCNPPFFEDFEELNQNKITSKMKEPEVDCKESEVVVPGGEVSFVKKMIDDSLFLRNRIKIYTSMFGKKKSLVPIKNVLKQINAKYICTEFCQGNTMRWGVAWTFCDEIQFDQIKCSKRKKKGKAITYDIPRTIEDVEYTISGMLKYIKSILREFEIIYGVKKENKQNALFWIKSKKNTWSHQRRKKRMTLLQTKIDGALHIEAATKEAGLLSSSSDHDPTSKLNVLITKSSQSENKQELTENLDNKELPDSYPQPTSSQSENKQELTENLDNKELPDSYPQSTKRKSDELSFLPLKPPKKIKNDCTSCESENISSTGLISNSNLCTEPPLLLCDVHLKKNDDKISLEMNCSENCNRQSMHEVLQLLKNRLR